MAEEKQCEELIRRVLFFDDILDVPSGRTRIIFHLYLTEGVNLKNKPISFEIVGEPTIDNYLGTPVWLDGSVQAKPEKWSDGFSKDDVIYIGELASVNGWDEGNLENEIGISITIKFIIDGVVCHQVYKENELICGY